MTVKADTKTHYHGRHRSKMTYKLNNSSFKKLKSIDANYHILVYNYLLLKLYLKHQ